MSSVKKPNRRGRQKKQLMDQEDLQKHQQYQKNQNNKLNKLNGVSDNMFDTAKLDKNYFVREQDKHQILHNDNDIMNFDEQQNISGQIQQNYTKQQNTQQTESITKTDKKRRRKPAKKQNIFGDDNQDDQQNTIQTTQKNTGDKLISHKEQEPNINTNKETRNVNKKLFQQQSSKKQQKNNVLSSKNTKQQQQISDISQGQNDKNHKKASTKQVQSPVKQFKQQKQQQNDEFEHAINQMQNKSDDDEQKIVYLHKQIRKLTNVQDKKDYYHKPLSPNSVAYAYFKRFSSGLSENYQLSGQDHVPLLFCQNQRGCIGCNYYISLTKQMDKNKPSYLGKLRGNAAGSTYYLYDDGIQPKNQINRSQWRITYAAVQYQNNFMGMNGPRKLKVTVPSAKFTSDMDVFKLSQQQSLTNFKPPVVSQYRNKTPKWNDKLKSYALNFGGRVKLASIKNFILIPNEYSIEDEDQCDNMIVFGKVDDSTFSVEYRHPLSLFQAFGIVMSQFDFKLSCQ